MNEAHPSQSLGDERERPSQVGATVRRFRLRQGWTLTDLAGRSGLSAGQLGRIERGIARPSAAALISIAGALGISVDDIRATAGHAEQSQTELIEVLDRLAIPRNIRHEFVGLAPESRQAFIGALQQRQPPNAERWRALPEIVEYLLANGLEASVGVIVSGIERFGLSPADFLRSAAQLEELPGERVVLTDRMPMTPLSFGMDQMHLFRATFGVDPPNPMLLKWWADARRTAINESLREHESRTVCTIDRLEHYFRTGERAPGIFIPFQTIRNHISALVALLRENPRYKMGLISQMPRLAYRIKGESLVLVSEAGFVLGPKRTRAGTALRFTRREAVSVFRVAFHRLWDDIPDEHKDSEAIAVWLEGWLDRIGQGEDVYRPGTQA